MLFLLRRARATVLGLTLAAVAVLTAEPASAYCRTTTEVLPPNYNPTSGCFTEGLPLFWRGACIGYSLNDAASRNIPFEDAKRVIDQSFATWMDTSCSTTGQPPGITISNLGKATCAEVKYNKETANQNLIVFRDDGWPYNDPNSTLGLTTVTFNAETGEIFDADMEINASGRNLSVTDQVPPNGFDLASVVTHEAGHFFGLAHATDSSATMYASYKPGSVALRDLATDDVDGLCAIYPTTATRIVGPSVAPTGRVDATACDPSPRHGLATVCTEPLAPKPDNCELTPGAAHASGTSAVWSSLAVVGVLVAARRRRRRRLSAR